MRGLCRTTNTCEAGLIEGALRITCNGLCTAVRLYSAVEHPGGSFKCGEGQALAPTNAISPSAILNDLLFKIAIRSDRLCIPLSWFVQAFAAAFNMQRTLVLDTDSRGYLSSTRCNVLFAVSSARSTSNVVFVSVSMALIYMSSSTRGFFALLSRVSVLSSTPDESCLAQIRDLRNWMCSVLSCQFAVHDGPHLVPDHVCATKRSMLPKRHSLHRQAAPPPASPA